MDCRDIEEKLSAYLDHQLSKEEKLSVDEHLLSCPKCGQELEDLKKTITHIGNLDDVEPPPWLEQKIMAGIREEAEGRKSLFQRLFSRLHINTPLQAFATLAVLLTAFVVFRTIEPEVEKSTVGMKMSATIEEETIARQEVKDKSSGGFGADLSSRKGMPGGVEDRPKQEGLERQSDASPDAEVTDIKRKQKPTIAVSPSPAQPPKRRAQAGSAPAMEMQEQARNSFAYYGREIKKQEPSEMTQKAVQFTLHGAAVPSEPMLFTDKGLDGRNLEEEIISDALSGISLVIDLVPVLEKMNVLGSDRYLVRVNITSNTLHIPESVSAAQREELNKEADNLVLSLSEWKRELDRHEVSLLDKNNELTIAIEEPLRNLRYFKYSPLELTVKNEHPTSNVQQ